ncbi:uncharacterized protein [Paralichthys olivaceus]|uniref:uncharacterized protein n=1 Tax=Paralichthys olivaceus TaxID=8255 RepID=UPI0037513B4A
MVRVYVFPNCQNKMTRWTKFSFHRLPLRNLDVLKLWLVPLRMDPNTEVKALKRADNRLCSAHLAPEDFFPIKAPKEGQKGPRQNDQCHPECCRRQNSASAEVDFPEPDFETVLQSTPNKSQHRTDKEPSGSSGPPYFSSALTLVLTSPPQTTTRTKRSLPGKYIALAPTWSHSVDSIPSISTFTSITAHPSVSTLSPLLQSEEEGEMDQQVLDVSMSFGYLGLDPADTSYLPPISDSASGTGTESGSASSHGDTATGWAEKKWLVNESYLLQLFKTCPECTSLITTITIRGSQIKIRWTCGKHCGDWQSCPDRRGMPENNLQICASTVFTGSAYTDIEDWATLLNIPIPHKTQFFNIQKTYILPTIQSAYQDKRDQIISRLTEDS